MKDAGKILCHVCRRVTCQCDRSAQRGRPYQLETFSCPHCPQEVFYCVNDRANHSELRHSTALILDLDMETLAPVPHEKAATNGTF